VQDENPIATEILFEDDEIVIWNQVIEAGETLGRHTHRHDYVLVTVHGEGPIDVEFHDGSGERSGLGSTIRLHTERGQATLVPRGHVETATNKGEQYRAILVELKR
jgi:hypothetical protein